MLRGEGVDVKASERNVVCALTPVAGSAQELDVVDRSPGVSVMLTRQPRVLWPDGALRAEAGPQLSTSGLTAALLGFG